MDHDRIARKTTATLFLAQSFGSAGMIAGGTVGAIVGAQLSGSAALAGLPAAVQLAGTAMAAYLVGGLMERFGRRRGMVAGILTGTLGALLAVTSIAAGSFLLFLGGLMLFGMTLASLQQGRFAAAEVHAPEHRGRAISYVVLGGTAGSVGGPLLVGPSGRLALSAGMDELIGPYVAAAGFIVLAALIVFALLRPDPRDVGRELEKKYPPPAGDGSVRTFRVIMASPRARIAVIAMVVGQGVMVLVMGMTGLHLRAHDHVLASISLVMSAHTLGMFAFSVVSGRLADTWGRVPVVLCGAVALVLGCSIAAFSSAVASVAIALFVVGLGWNFCYVGGSALLSDQLTAPERSRNQGINDLLIYSCTAAISIGSGVLFATIGYTGIGLAGAAISAGLILLIVGGPSSRRNELRVAPDRA